MTLWHQTNDARASARLENGVWWLDLEIGTCPIEPGQSVSVEARVGGHAGIGGSMLCQASWDYNSGVNSYWHAKLGPFGAGDCVEYSLSARLSQEKVSAGPFPGGVGPQLFFSILWPQNYPSFGDSVFPHFQGR